MKRGKLKSRVKVVEKRIKLHLSSFQREFRKHLSTFLTGSFAFVTALLWRDTIRSFLNYYEELIKTLIPIKEIWFVQLIITIAVTVVAVLSIVMISKILKIEE